MQQNILKSTHPHWKKVQKFSLWLDLLKTNSDFPLCTSLSCDIKHKLKSRHCDENVCITKRITIWFDSIWNSFFIVLNYSFWCHLKLLYSKLVSGRIGKVGAKSVWRKWRVENVCIMCVMDNIWCWGYYLIEKIRWMEFPEKAYSSAYVHAVA